MDTSSQVSAMQVFVNHQLERQNLQLLGVCCTYSVQNWFRYAFRNGSSIEHTKNASLYIDATDVWSA